MGATTGALLREAILTSDASITSPEVVYEGR
jgi:hypothetical protein